MTTDKLQVLISKLRQKTSEAGIAWEQTSNDSEYQTVLGNHILRLREVYAETPEPDYILRIQNEEGAILESVSDVQIHKDNPNFGAFSVMTELYSMARRSAMGIDKALDSILSELEN